MGALGHKKPVLTITKGKYLAYYSWQAVPEFWLDLGSKKIGLLYKNNMLI